MKYSSKCFEERGVSIIVCCYNSEEKIGKTLRALAQQQFSFPVEVILVDNACKDRTVEVARRLWENLGSPFELIVVEESTPGLIHARKAGVARARYFITVFCDDDNALCVTYLSSVWECFSDNLQIGALGGEGVVVSDIEIPFWFKSFSFLYACFPQTNPSVLYGAGMAVRTSILKAIFFAEVRFHLVGRVGSHLLGGDDHELSHYIKFAGYELGYLPDMKFEHFMPKERLSLEYLERLVRGSGYSAPLLWPYENSSGILLYSSYKVLRLLLGFPKILLKHYSSWKILKIRLKMHWLFVVSALSSLKCNWQLMKGIREDCLLMKKRLSLKKRI